MFFCWLSEWIPHPLNLIVKNFHSARPEDHVLAENGILIRPLQGCPLRYGYAINLNRITKMTGTVYLEHTERRFTSPVAGTFVGTSAWNELEDLVVINTIRR